MSPTEVTVTYLEMTERPGAAPPLPVAARVAVMAAGDPPVDWFLYLYRAVGGPWHWTDWLTEPEERVRAFVGDPAVTLHTLMLEGWPAGFFLLDARERGTVDLAYFGLVPQATGRGLGRWFLGTAVRTAWDRPDVERVTVNTCTLDHPAALGLYQRMGFEPVRRVTELRELDPA